MTHRKTHTAPFLRRAPGGKALTTAVKQLTFILFSASTPFLAGCDALSPEVINALVGLVGPLPPAGVGGVSPVPPAPAPLPVAPVPVPPPAAAAPDPAAQLATGRAFYDQMCAVCHGANGEGGVVDPTPLGPGLCAVAGSGGCQDAATLQTYIGGNMPSVAAPCPADCAESTAVLVMSFGARSFNTVSAGPAYNTHCVGCHNDETGNAGILTADNCLTVDCGDVTELSPFIMDHISTVTLTSKNECDAQCALETALFISTEKSFIAENDE